MNPTEPIDRAHLRDPRDRRFDLARYSPSAECVGLVRGYWVPVWSVPHGEASDQEVLQYPICLIVVSNSYARFYGVVRGLSRTTLVGDGWAFGVMLQPAAGLLIGGRSVRHFTDRYVDLGEIRGLPGGALSRELGDLMAAGPDDVGIHHRAIAHFEAALTPLLPIDPEGASINAIVDYVETDPDVVRVGQICDRFALTERSLQRLTQRRLGLGPKWLIRRRRMHEAVSGLKSGDDLAALAARLGYADQSHFTRDFKAVTGWTPGRLALRYA
ncbi:MAG: AraC family transcriptional regulator [Nocardioides sp.]